MVPIYINTQQVSDNFAVDESTISSLKKAVLISVVEDFERLWRKKADENLFKTRKRYKRSIQKEYIDDSNAVMYIDPQDWVSNAVESGIGAYDMKPNFANSPKRKEKKDGGWYLTIPFRWSASDSIGESEAFSGKMPEKVYEVAKEVLPGRKEGMRLSEVPEEYRPPKVRKAVGQWDAYINKTSLYQGMVRNDKDNHATYTTFRRVSDKSDPNSWIHSGIKARDLAGKAMSEFEGSRMNTIVQNIVGEFVDSL